MFMPWTKDIPYFQQLKWTEVDNIFISIQMHPKGMEFLLKIYTLF